MLSLWQGGGNVLNPNSVNGILLTFAITITGAGAQLTFSGGTMPTGIVGGNILISQINGLAN